MLHGDFVLRGGALPYYESLLFSRNGIRHAFFTRKGGVSTGVFESLNFAVGIGNVRDDNEKVLRNYEIAASLFGLTAGDVCRSYQTHTSHVIYVDEHERGKGVTQPPFDFGVDGLVTSSKNLLLSVRTADCVPVLLCDPAHGLCAAIHAGWRGTVGGITANALDIMEASGAKREDILAAIGPCIGQCCYEVGAELLDEFCASNKQYSRYFALNGDKFMLDLTGANAFLLESNGVKPENISCAGLCTRCREDEFFSHRRSGSDRGTMSAFICL